MAKRKKRHVIKKMIETHGKAIFFIILAAVVLGAVTNLANSKAEKTEKIYLQKLGLLENKLNKLALNTESLSGRLSVIEIQMEQKSIKKKPSKNLSAVSHLLKPVELKNKIKRIHHKEAKMLFDSGKALFIDARSLREYNKAHIKGSIPMQANLVDANIPKYKKLMEDKVLVTYCHGIGCRLSDKVAYRLFDRGYKKVCIFFGGWNEWNEKKYPVTTNKGQ